MFNRLSRPLLLAALLILVLAGFSLSVVGAQSGAGSGDSVPTDTISFNFTSINLTVPTTGNRSFSNVVVGPSDTPNGMTISFDVTTTNRTGQSTTHHIIAVLIALFADNRLSYTLENTMISGYAATDAQNTALRRGIVRAFNNFLRSQIGTGHRIVGFEVTSAGINVSYR